MYKTTTNVKDTSKTFVGHFIVLENSLTCNTFGGYKKNVAFHISVGLLFYILVGLLLVKL